MSNSAIIYTYDVFFCYFDTCNKIFLFKYLFFSPFYNIFLLGIRGRGHVTINQIVADTALHPADIALAFMLLGNMDR